MKKFKLYYQGVRTSNKFGGFFKDKRFGVIEYDDENREEFERLEYLLKTLSEKGYKCTNQDLGFSYVEVSDVEEFYQFRNDFRNIEKYYVYYDPEYDRLTDETYIRRQYENFCKESWFNKSYEEFLSENFEVVC